MRERGREREEERERDRENDRKRDCIRLIRNIRIIFVIYAFIILKIIFNYSIKLGIIMYFLNLSAQLSYRRKIKLVYD